MENPDELEMKFLRIGRSGEEKPCVLDRDGQVRDISAFVPEISGANFRALAELEEAALRDFPVVAEGMRIGPCVGSVGKIVGVGLNYADHAAESGMAAPSEPLLFMKATSAISGPYDDVIQPVGSTKVDWEVELGIVIGVEAKNVPLEHAMEHVFGYCIVNDVSERTFQLERGGQFMKGKCADTFAPIGPWLVTRDEIPDPQALAMWLEVDRVRYQSGNTANMIFPVDHIVSYVSEFMRLEPGDLITTGTPAGVGMGQKPPKFLVPGQVMELSIEGLGRQRQITVRAA